MSLCGGEVILKKIAILLRVYGYLHWHYLRKILPRTSPQLFNNVPTGRWNRIGDALLPSPYNRERRNRPTYETGLCIALRAALSPGNRVVIVGGGHGITTALCAQIVGTTGSVDLFEGSAKHCTKVKKLLERSHLLDRVRINHAIVARNIAVYPGEIATTTVEPEKLPECDVLELDCEGAERDILDGLLIRPSHIIVETHGIHGAPSRLIEEKLREMGYEVVPLGVAEVDKAPYCLENDIMVLWGRPGTTRALG